MKKFNLYILGLNRVKSTFLLIKNFYQLLVPHFSQRVEKRNKKSRLLCWVPSTLGAPYRNQCNSVEADGDDSGDNNDVDHNDDHGEDDSGTDTNSN